MKVLVANGRGNGGAGAISLPGAEVGDTVTGILAQLPGGLLESVDDGWFETTISVEDEIQQLLPLIHVHVSPTSGAPYTLGVDGNPLAAPHGVNDRPQVKQDPGFWRYVFLLEPAE